MKSYFSDAVDNVFLILTAISVLLLLLITVLMVYFIIKYKKEKNPVPSQIESNTFLEILWTIVPTIIVIWLFFEGWAGFDFLRKVPENPLEIKVKGRMWSWLFEYPSGKKSDKLYVPQNTPVKLVLTSSDVIHSLYIPALRVKEDALPGLQTYLWFTADNTGEYDIFCAEYCGTGHSSMITKLIVMNKQDFEKWLTETPQVSGVSIGFELLKEKGCLGCHSTDGSQSIGPTFKGIFMRKTVVSENGKEKEIEADESYIRNSILDPKVMVVKGYQPLMPEQKDLISEEELNQIVAYLKTLK